MMIPFRPSFKYINGALYSCVGMRVFVTDDFGNAVEVTRA